MNWPVISDNVVIMRRYTILVVASASLFRMRGDVAAYCFA